MKRIFSLLPPALALLASALLLFACSSPAVPEATAPPAATAAATPIPTEAPTPAPAPADTPTPTLTPTPTPTATATPTASPTPTPAGPRMYSSYADLITFDPETGIAKFDYFDMLRGEEAVDFLVSHEGYTQADAEELVDNFADSEYVKKNTNPQLRAIDLRDVSLKLMVHADGTAVDGATPVSATITDFRAVFALDPNLLLKSYFYYVTVKSDGTVSKVEQVYWP